LERLSKLGQTEISAETAETIIKNSFLKKEVVVAPKTKLRTDKPSYPQPTLSRNEDPSAAAEIQTKPLLAKDRLGVFRQLPVTDCHDQWEALNDEANAIAAKWEDFEVEPMCCMCRGISAAKAIGEDASVKWFAIAMSKFRISDYPTRMPIVCYRFDSYYTPTSVSVEIDYFIINVAFFHWIENDFRATGHQQRFALEDFERFINWMIVTKDFVALKAFEDSVTRSKQLPLWMKSMLLGKMKYEIGYSYRGTGEAQTVTDEGWEKLEEHCTAAQDDFTEAYRLQPQFPESSAAMIDIARLGYADEDEDYWFEKSIEHEPEFLLAYHQLVWGLYPRWGGSTEEMVDFVLNNSKDSDSDCVAFLLPREIFHWRNNGEFDPDQWEELVRNPKVNQEALAALDKIISKEQSVVVENKIYKPEFFRTVKAVLAAKAGKYEVSEATFDELGNKFSHEAVNRLVANVSSFNAMRSSVYAFTSEYQADARELKKLWGNSYEQRHKNADEILAITEELSEWVGTHSGGLYFKKAQEILQAELAFLEAPLPLKFDEDFLLWNSNDFSQTEFVSPETMRIDNRRNSARFRIRTSAQFMQQRVFECDVKFPKLPASFTEASPSPSQRIVKKSKTSQKAVPPKQSEEDLIYDFRPSVGVGTVGKLHLMIGLGPVKQAKRKRNAASYNGVLTFGPSRSRDELVNYKVNLRPDQNRLKILFGPKYVEVYLNSQFVFRSFSEKFDWSRLIVLQQPMGAQGRGVVEFSNLVVRTWEQGPPPTLPRDAEALIEYYGEAVEAEPENAWAKFWLAHAKHLAKDFEGAIPLYEQAIAAGITTRFAGFYIGDACDRSGRYEDALSWYKKANDPAAAPCPHVQQGKYVYTGTPPEKCALFRLQWILATKGELTDDEMATLKSTGNSNISFNGPGQSLSSVGFNLAIARRKDKYEIALKSIERHLDFLERSKNIGDYRETLQPVLDALRDQRIYVRPENAPPIYLKYRDEDKFFAHFERKHLATFPIVL